MELELFRRSADLLRVLAHPTRLAILENLRQGSRCVSDINDLLDISQPNLSQHLTVLRREKIIDYFENGKRRCYFLVNPKMANALLGFLEEYFPQSSSSFSSPQLGTKSPFDTEATRYDAWFDSPKGKAIFEQEAACLKDLLGNIEGRWLEVGVGTGRFADALGIREGIDPSSPALQFALKRGIQAKVGHGEDLPYSQGSFDGILMVVTICFLDEPCAAIMESLRVLKDGGRLVLGLVPSKSTWGELYSKKSQNGHRFYSSATFYTCEEVINLATTAGFNFSCARSCLFSSPSQIVQGLQFKDGVDEQAGFVALQFTK